MKPNFNISNCSLTVVIVLCFFSIGINFKLITSESIPLKPQEQQRPNIILIVTDDQDLTLNGLTPMAKTLSLVADQGVMFTNAFTSSPICCPSRSSILTGQYAHNHLTLNNTRNGGCYGAHWKESVETDALPVHLNHNGYNTFFAGKYLNEYFSKDVPIGWNEWYGLHGNSKYYNYTLNENGQLKSYGTEYLTDVLKTFTINFLKKQNKDVPFFAMITPPAPHAPFTAADRHLNTFESVTALRTPNFNIPINNILDKHWLLRMLPLTLPDYVLTHIDVFYRQRWQSLLAVDELIEQVHDELNAGNLLENTYIIFTSDNGYHMGQFAQAYDKRQPYETDIRVPLLIRGPNILPKTLNHFPVALIDLLPTILDLADIKKPQHLDGISLRDYLLKNNTESNHNNKSYTMQWETSINTITAFTDAAADDDDDDDEGNQIDESNHYERFILIEYWGEGNSNTYNPDCPWKPKDNLQLCTSDAGCHCQDTKNNTYACVRHIAQDLNKIYCEFEDKENFVEAYDLQSDPYQLQNLGYSMLPSERAQYSLKLGYLKQCAGIGCHL